MNYRRQKQAVAKVLEEKRALLKRKGKRDEIFEENDQECFSVLVQGPGKTC